MAVINKYEKACKEGLKSCSCAPKDKPEECNECTEGFRKYLQGLVADEKSYKEAVNNFGLRGFNKK